MLESENVVGDGVSSRHADMPVLYGAMQDGRTLAGFNGRRAAMSIGALLVACFFLVLSSDSVQELPAVLFGGRWRGEFTSSRVYHAPVYRSVDKAMAAGLPVEDNASIGRGLGVSGRWSSSFAQPALPSTGVYMSW